MFVIHHLREHAHISNKWASENLGMTVPSYTFPPLDLLESLVEHYFTQINPFLPLLHRPTFQRGIDENLYLIDQYFGAVVLLVCALGSRYSEDSRVFVEGSDSVRSAGWKWFDQVRILRASFFKQTSLHELQAYAVRYSAWILRFIADRYLLTSSLFSSRSRQRCHKDVGVKSEWHFDLLRKSALTEDDLKVILFPQLKKNCGSGHFGKVERLLWGPIDKFPSSIIGFL